MKSIPRLASGDKDSLPNGSAKTAAYFRTVILANVKPVDVDEKEFELTQIGIGICVPRKGEEKDVVVAADRLEALGLHLSMGRKDGARHSVKPEMAEGRIIASTPTFALFRSPATVAVAGNEHRKVNLNYAFCVERNDGKTQRRPLDVGAETQGGAAAADNGATELEPDFRLPHRRAADEGRRS